MGDGMSRGHRLDEIDRRVVYALMRDARNTSAAAIAEKLSVSGATIRNRISQLKDHGIIEGYHARVDLEQADGSLMNLFCCHAPFGDVEGATRRIGAIPGVINVRELMGGRLNLHVLAVGTDTSDLRRIGTELEGCGVEVEDEFLLENELYTPDDDTEIRPHDVVTVFAPAGTDETALAGFAPDRSEQTT